MNDDPLGAVYDCVVYLQGLINPTGPAGECIRYLLDGTVKVYASVYVFFEFIDVARRPRIAEKFAITESDIQRFMDPILRRVELVATVPHVIDLAADPDDAHYLNLAIATTATFVVSRDSHLLRLMDPDIPEAAEFQRCFPQIRVVTPPQFLQEVRARNKSA